MKKRKMTEELANELERQSDEDAELWKQEPTQIEARSTRTSVLSLRLPTSEFHGLLRAARAAGESVSEYVRKAIAMRQAREPIAPTINIAYTYQGMTNDTASYPYWRTYTSGNPQSEPVLSK